MEASAKRMAEEAVINISPWIFRQKMKFNIASEASVEICNSKIDAFRYNLLPNAWAVFYRAFPCITRMRAGDGENKI